MEYSFFFSTASDGEHWHKINASNLNEGLSLLAEHVLRKFPDMDYLGTTYYVSKNGKKSARKLRQSAKSYFWTFLSIQKKMEDFFEKNKVL